MKAAQLSAVNQLGKVHVPRVEVRQWRALIAYRQQLVQRRTRMRNHLRDLLQREGMLLPRGRKAWTQVGMSDLQALVKPLADVPLHELWRGELGVELAQLRELQQQIQTVAAKLDELGAADAGVQFLQTIQGVGPRLAEAAPIFPSSFSFCPASPSLQWVPWASVPHLPGLPYCYGPDHRYYAPLRLPLPIWTNFTCRSLVHTLVAAIYLCFQGTYRSAGQDSTRSPEMQ